MDIGNRKYSHFRSSKGTRGWYTTLVENEAIKFPEQLTCLEVRADQTDLALLINNDVNDPWYIDAGQTDGIDGLTISHITVVGPAGQKIFWKGLTDLIW